jgi:hypothetical protein
VLSLRLTETESREKLGKERKRQEIKKQGMTSYLGQQDEMRV